MSASATREISRDPVGIVRNWNSRAVETIVPMTGGRSLRGGENVVALTKKELIALGLLLLAILALTLMSENIVVV
jgi:hypothetical protein